MKFFTEDFQNFFKDLSQNNHTNWFHAHKNEYETHVKKPFEQLIGDLISEISKHEDLGNITIKDCILRINKDIRFSKDKSPYNTHVTAFISKGGGKDKSIPGLFLRLSTESIGIMGGCFGPDKTQIDQIRKFIQDNLSSFQSINSSPAFISKYGKIQGESLKRIPEDLVDIAQTEPLILNKQWYFVTEMDASFLQNPKLFSEIMECYHTAKPINDFLTKAISK
ncbi:MAG TPA: DUF2461 domain-containing protein [Saprospiraceae bacterium]|nr:DUF2461 domain-containing protein [Saprospiraceae bacterium]